MHIGNFKDPGKRIQKLEKKLKKVQIRAEDAEHALRKLTMLKTVLEAELESSSKENEKLHQQLRDLTDQVDRLLRDPEGFVVIRRKEVVVNG